MELDLVDAVAGGVVAARDRRVGMGQPGQRLGIMGARPPAQRRQPVMRPARALALQRLGQAAVGAEDIVIGQRRRLVQRLRGCRMGRSIRS